MAAHPVELFTMFPISVLMMTVAAAAPAPSTPTKMPLTGLAPSVAVENLCLYRYPVSTRSEECRQFCDQALGYFYSYVWIEAARSFETALKHDPDCAFAWLGLHRAMEKWNKSAKAEANPILGLTGGSGQQVLPNRFTKSVTDFALEEAKRLMNHANAREQLLIRAKLEEKGMAANVKPDERAKKAAATLDELLMLYEDDQEGWFARAQIADGGNAKAVYYKALLMVNPVHPGANHELVHFFENIRRPALGWRFAEGYMQSSPKLPHAFHMQAHLAMRIGKWAHTTDWSMKAYQMEKEYHRVQGVKPGEDHQFRHHMQTLMRALTHEGRFAEVDALQREADGYKYTNRPELFEVAIAREDWAAAQKIVNEEKRNKTRSAYYTARIALEQGNIAKARAAVDVLRQAAQGKKSRANREAEEQLWETQGRLMCRTGQGEAGSKLLKRAVDKMINDYSAHAWGAGASAMECWGIGALEAGRAVDAEEGFLEALAHDAGSVRGALGMWALCERLGRTNEAERFLKVARRCWAKAAPADFAKLQASFAKKAENIPLSSATASVGK